MGRAVPAGAPEPTGQDGPAGIVPMESADPTPDLDGTTDSEETR